MERRTVLGSILLLVLLAGVSVTLGITIAKQLPQKQIPVRIRIVNSGGIPISLSASEKSRVMEILENSTVYKKLVSEGYVVTRMYPVVSAKLKIDFKTGTGVLEASKVTGATVFMENGRGSIVVLTVSLVENRVVGSMNTTAFNNTLRIMIGQNSVSS